MPIGPNYVHKQRTCGHKISHRKEFAIREAIRMTGLRGHRFDAYQCIYCTGWHVGHAPEIESADREPS